MGASSGIYREMAEGVQMLVSKIGPDSRKMYVGLDGRIVGHLMSEYCQKNRARSREDFENTVQISSRSNESDREKFFEILGDHTDISNTLYAIDLRTKTGSLGKMIRDLSREFFKVSGNYVPVSYAVLYDQNGYADVRAYEKRDLSDENRINWLPSMDHVNSIFKDVNGSWKRPYDISEKSIDEISHVRRIVDFL